MLGSSADRDMLARFSLAVRDESRLNMAGSETCASASPRPASLSPDHHRFQLDAAAVNGGRSGALTTRDATPESEEEPAEVSDGECGALSAGAESPSQASDWMVDSPSPAEMAYREVVEWGYSQHDGEVKLRNMSSEDSSEEEAPKEDELPAASPPSSLSEGQDEPAYEDFTYDEEDYASYGGTECGNYSEEADLYGMFGEVEMEMADYHVSLAY